MQLVWTTDPHLDQVQPHQLIEFAKRIQASGADACVITGDIANGLSIAGTLRLLTSVIAMPIYYVLGNHDYWGMSRSSVHASLKAFPIPGTQWLTDIDCIELSPSTGLVGEDGWYDGRAGKQYGSPIALNDWDLMDEFIGKPHFVLRQLFADLGTASALSAKEKLEKAFLKYQHVFFATHVPPYPESAWYAGKPSDANWLPFMTNCIMGEMLYRLMDSLPGKKLHVLCGHSHGKREFRPIPNLLVTTGYARYKHPAINKIFSVST